MFKMYEAKISKGRWEKLTLQMFRTELNEKGHWDCLVVLSDERKHRVVSIQEADNTFRGFQAVGRLSRWRKARGYHVQGQLNLVKIVREDRRRAS